MCKSLNHLNQINNIKELLTKSEKSYSDRIAYKLKKEKGYVSISYSRLLQEVNCLGTSLIDIGLKGKRIAVIGNNRYEWELAYLAITCGTGIVVPLDKALPDNELKSLVERSEVEAIVYSDKYENLIKEIKSEHIGKLKYLISMDLEQSTKEEYSIKDLVIEGSKSIRRGNRQFIDAEINSDKMGIMLFTSGTTAKSKVVALSQKNICSNLMAVDPLFRVTDSEVFLSLLPLHHVFECTLGFLLPLYIGGEIVFCDGLRHIVENISEYGVTEMLCVPAVYEQIYKNVMKQFEKTGKMKQIQLLMKICNYLPMNIRALIFKQVHDKIGSNIRHFICGAAALDANTEIGLRQMGFGFLKGYGLTETSPVIAAETYKYFKTGTVGKALQNVQVKIVDPDENGIGELAAKGPNIMLGYYNNEEATKESIKDGWFYTGDLAKIDDEGYISICGRKKSVIVLKNGKNIFPEEMENLLNKIDGVKESFIYGKTNSDDKDDIKINAEIVYDEKEFDTMYDAKDQKDIYKIVKEKIHEINMSMPAYKAIRGIILTDKPLIKTTTLKIKRQEEIKKVQCI